MHITVTMLALIAQLDGGTTALVDTVARDVIGDINEGAAERLFSRFDPAMQRAFPQEKVAALVSSIRSNSGRVELGAKEPGGQELGAAWELRAAKGSGPGWRFTLNVDPQARVRGLGFKERVIEPPVQQSALPLRLPMQGRWLVVWGGATAELNQHVLQPSQRRAADLIVVDDGGVSHRGDGQRNADYLAYGAPIVAVADGTVEAVIDGIADNEPGHMNRYYVPGNMVVLRHDGGLYSSYAHLQPGLALKKGARVKRGAVLGRCGNSGNSSEPHLHFQLQDGPLFDRAWGVEPVFDQVAVQRDGGILTVERYTWLKGDLVTAP